MGMGLAAPILIRLFSLNFHISAFRKEIMTFLQSDYSLIFVYLLLVDNVYVMPCIHDIFFLNQFRLV